MQRQIEEILESLEKDLRSRSTRQELARALNLAVGTLANLGQKIPYVLCGGKAIYEKRAVLIFYREYLLRSNGLLGPDVQNCKP